MNQGYNPVLAPSSPQAGDISHLFWGVLIVCGIVFAVVAGLVAISVWRFRGRPGTGEPRQVFGNRKLEFAWTLVPFLIVVWLTYLAFGVMRSSNPPAGRAPDLLVIGHQWWWEVRYPNAGVVTANEIHIPVGQKLLVRLESADVIHDFWVPQLAPKSDMIPGHPNHLWLQADRAGTYHGACAEFCGAEHAWMRFLVIAEPAAEFQAWLRQQEQVAPPPVTDSAAYGLRLFKDMTCLNCHPIRGVSTAANAAPDLTHLASRRTLAAGALKNNATNLARWLRNPETVKPGSRMPNLKLTEAQVNDLVSYLGSLQ
jgi:cytochrome c oxidase subunit II